MLYSKFTDNYALLVYLQQFLGLIVNKNTLKILYFFKHLTYSITVKTILVIIFGVQQKVVEKMIILQTYVYNV